MGCPLIVIPGYFASAQPYGPLIQMLRDRGRVAEVVPLRLGDWVPTVGGRSVSGIIDRLDATVQAVRSRHNADQVDLIGHSAGGWIARIYLGDRTPYQVHRADQKRAERGQPTLWKGRAWVRSLLTLGTPQQSQERWTRRNLNFVNQAYPGAFYDDVRYICVAGRALQGQRPAQQKGQWLAFNSYELTCGDGNAWGDGITPIAAAHLDGATNLTLEGVWHSPTSPGPWYGDRAIVPQWLDAL